MARWNPRARELALGGSDERGPHALPPGVRMRVERPQLAGPGRRVVVSAPPDGREAEDRVVSAEGDESAAPAPFGEVARPGRRALLDREAGEEVVGEQAGVPTRQDATWVTATRSASTGTALRMRTSRGCRISTADIVPQSPGRGSG